MDLMDRILRRILSTTFLNETEELYDAGGHNLGAVVRYKERNHELRIIVRSLRTRFSSQHERVHPRATHVAQFL